MKDPKTSAVEALRLRVLADTAAHPPEPGEPMLELAEALFELADEHERLERELDELRQDVRQLSRTLDRA